MVRGQFGKDYLVSTYKWQFGNDKWLTTKKWQFGNNNLVTTEKWQFGNDNFLEYKNYNLVTTKSGNQVYNYIKVTIWWLHISGYKDIEISLLLVLSSFIV